MISRTTLPRLAATLAVAVLAVLVPAVPAQAASAPVLAATNVGNRTIALSTPTELFPSYVYLGCTGGPIARWDARLLDAAGATVRVLVPPLAQRECTSQRAFYTPVDGTDGAGNRLPDGDYTLRVVATDDAGQAGTIDIAFVVDTRVPGILDAPQPGATLSGTVPLALSPTPGTTVTRVDWVLSGCGQVAATAPSPRGVFTAALDVGRCTVGSQTLTTTVQWVGRAGEPLFYQFATPVTVASPPPAPTLTLVTPPVVSGTPTVGERFAATTGTWSPRNVTIAFQWLADGAPIPGATFATYYPTGAELGKRLSVTVTATAPGYATATATSTPSSVIQQGRARISPAPYITGTARVGSTLQGYGGTSSRGATISLQWLRNGTPIPGATGETYLLTTADQGAFIRFRVTASGPGYIPTTATSAATAAVAPR